MICCSSALSPNSRLRSSNLSNKPYFKKTETFFKPSKAHHRRIIPTLRTNTMAQTVRSRPFFPGIRASPAILACNHERDWDRIKSRQSVWCQCRCLEHDQRHRPSIASTEFLGRCLLSSCRASARPPSGDGGHGNGGTARQSRTGLGGQSCACQVKGWGIHRECKKGHHHQCGQRPISTAFGGVRDRKSEILENADIQVKVDNPNVGENLMEHMSK